MPAPYRLYIDESGDHSFRADVSGQWDKRYLCLLGCSFELEDYRNNFSSAFEHLKAEHFGSEPDELVILHREEMVARRGPFSVLREMTRNEAFRRDLLELVTEARFRVFAVVVDKIGTQGKRYGPLPSHPYDIGVLAMMERYCGWLNFTRNTGDVLAESRGGREDGQLKSAYRTVYDSGTRFRPKEFSQAVLTTREIKLKKKEHNIAGLQLADLLAYPVKREMLHQLKQAPPPTGFTKTMAELLSQRYKYNYHAYQGRVWGYGKVFLG
jgi:hypothetical protein